MNTILYSEIYKNQIITIEPDEITGNPVKDMDFLGTMVCWHEKYLLGHDQPKECRTQYIAKLLLDTCYDEIIGENEFVGDVNEFLSNNPKVLQEYFNKHFYCFPLFLHDNHTKISISTEFFFYGWDTKDIGFIYVSKRKASEELFNHNIKKVYYALKSEIDAYNKHLTGNVYKYSIYEIPADFNGYDDDLDIKTLNCIDSLGAIYPNHNDLISYDEAIRQAKEYIDYFIQ